jgi:hypothetical protein
VLGARVRLVSGRRSVHGLEEGVDVLSLERLRGPVVELAGRLRGSGVDGGPRVEPAQVVRREPRTHDERALVAQGGESGAELEQAPRVERGHRHLEHRDVGVGVHLHQRDVRTVVQPPRLLAQDGRVESGHESLDPIGELRRPGRVVGDLVVLLREPPEVVEQRRPPRGRAQSEGHLLPVRGHHEHVGGLGEAGRPRGKLAGPHGVVGQQWRAVAEVQHGLAGGVDGAHRASVTDRWFNL